MNPRLSRIASVLVFAALLLAWSGGCANLTAKLDQAAADSTKAAVLSDLTKLVQQSSADAVAAQDVIDHWDAHTEAENYLLATPQMNKWVVLHPEDDGAARVMRNWSLRLQKAGAFPK